MEIKELLQLVRTRRSIRRFKPDPVPEECIQTILDAGRWAMSGANGQPWEFIVIKDNEMKRKLAELFEKECTPGVDELEMHLREEFMQPTVFERRTGDPGFREAPVVIVVIGDRRTVQASVLAGYLFHGQRVLYKNLACCAQLMHLVASTLGLGTRWVSIPEPYMEDFKSLLGVPRFFLIDYLIPVGYPAYEAKPGYRRELKEIVHWEKYDTSKFRSNKDVADWIIGLRTQMRRHYSAKSPTKTG